MVQSAVTVQAEKRFLSDWAPPEEESSWKMCLCWVLKANQRLKSRDGVARQGGHYLLTLPRDVNPQRASVIFGCFQGACTSTTNMNFLNFLPSPAELHHDHLSYFIILNIRPKLHLPPGLWASSFPAPLFSYLPASFSTSYPAHQLINILKSLLSSNNKNYSLATLKGKKKTIWLLSSLLITLNLLLLLLLLSVCCNCIQQGHQQCPGVFNPNSLFCFLFPDLHSCSLVHI